MKRVRGVACGKRFVNGQHCRYANEMCAKDVLIT